MAPIYFAPVLWLCLHALLAIDSIRSGSGRDIGGALAATPALILFVLGFGYAYVALSELLRLIAVRTGCLAMTDKSEPPNKPLQPTRAALPNGQGETSGSGPRG